MMFIHASAWQFLFFFNSLKLKAKITAIIFIGPSEQRVPDCLLQRLQHSGKLRGKIFMLLIGLHFGNKFCILATKVCFNNAITKLNDMILHC